MLRFKQHLSRILRRFEPLQRGRSRGKTFLRFRRFLLGSSERRRNIGFEQPPEKLLLERDEVANFYRFPIRRRAGARVLGCFRIDRGLKMPIIFGLVVNFVFKELNEQ